MVNREKIDLIKIYLATGLAVFGCVMLFVGMMVAPVGIVDTSIIIAVGEIFTFSGTLIGIQGAYAVKHKELEDRINEKLKNN